MNLTVFRCVAKCKKKNSMAYDFMNSRVHINISSSNSPVKKIIDVRSVGLCFEQKTKKVRS